MTTHQFKTNIKCGGCIAAVTPFLTPENGIESWEVDLKNPDRILTVTTEKNSEAIEQQLQKAGYEATLI